MIAGFVRFSLWTMQDFNLNSGGLVGAAVGGVGTLAVALALATAEAARLVVFAVIVGAVCGNWLWKRYILQAVCPRCGRMLRTEKAKQCFICGEDWH